MPKAQDSMSEVELLKSEVVQREVWTKESKAVVAVRKLLVWKTYKEKTNSLYPAYVIHWTDYSHGIKNQDFYLKQLEDYKDEK